MITEKIIRTVYAYGSFRQGHFGYLVLRYDGSIGFYEHPNESGFQLKKDVLRFVNACGAIDEEEFRYDSRRNTFFSTSRYLNPVVLLAGNRENVRSRVVFVNSIPKAGTYLLEALLSALQLQSIKLHLSSDFFDDNRLMGAHEIHRAPHLRRVACPAAAVASIMRPGEFVVGHIGDAQQLRAIGDGGLLIHLVRDLRSALVSLYRFKQEKVAPLDPADLLWRALPEPDRFKAFLINSGRTDLPYVAAVADAVLQCGAGLRLRFEDITDPGQTGDVCASLSSALDMPVSKLTKSLRQVLSRSTSTLSKSPTRPDTVGRLWCDDVETFFRSTGLYSLNQRLGYE